MKRKINTIFENIFWLLFFATGFAICYAYYFEADPEIKASIFTAAKIAFVPTLLALVIYVETCDLPKE